jgi:hypothetical protein
MDVQKEKKEGEEMTDDAFEAFWFLYQSSQETLRELAVRAARTGDKKSHITVVSPNMSNSMQRAALCTSALDFGAYLLIATTCSTLNVPKATFHGSVKCSRC